ncbi:TIR domain-containing protein [Streptomyces sediminimaris]|uniref:TIR domain-containing protein n=1 Tax=Streptomyces sediminimaris TaxID=3383721 RepID=UPI00399AA885
MAPSIFVNFRRADTGETGVHIDTALVHEFGKDAVFRDQRSIAEGAYFADDIDRNLRKSDLILVVMGPRWASLRDGENRRLIDDESDWVRREVAFSLAMKLTVLPVLVGDAKLPDWSELPQDIAALTTRQAAYFRPHQAHIDFPPLVQAIRRAVPGLRPARHAEPEGEAAGNAGVNVRIDRADASPMVFGGHHNTASTNPSPSPRENAADHSQDDEERP